MAQKPKIKFDEAVLLAAVVTLASWQEFKTAPKQLPAFLQRQGFTERQIERIEDKAVHYARRIRSVDHPLMNLVEFGVYDNATAILALIEPPAPVVDLALEKFE